MKTDQYGQIIYNESDLVSMIMRDATIESLNGMLVEPGVTLETASAYLEQVPELVEYAFTDMTVEEFDADETELLAHARRIQTHGHC
jgi:hypothetical protein